MSSAARRPRSPFRSRAAGRARTPPAARRCRSRRVQHGLVLRHVASLAAARADAPLEPGRGHAGTPREVERDPSTSRSVLAGRRSPVTSGASGSYHAGSSPPSERGRAHGTSATAARGSPANRRASAAGDLAPELVQAGLRARDIGLEEGFSLGIAEAEEVLGGHGRQGRWITKSIPFDVSSSSSSRDGPIVSDAELG